MRDYLLALCCAAAVFAGVVACFLPAGYRAPVPAAPYCDEVQPQPVAVSAAPTETKTCNPACTAPQVCIDGTCCLPAVSHSPGSNAAFAWVADSLR